MGSELASAPTGAMLAAAVLLAASACSKLPMPSAEKEEDQKKGDQDSAIVISGRQPVSSTARSTTVSVPKQSDESTTARLRTLDVKVPDHTFSKKTELSIKLDSGGFVATNDTDILSASARYRFLRDGKTVPRSAVHRDVTVKIYVTTTTERAKYGVGILAHPKTEKETRYFVKQKDLNVKTLDDGTKVLSYPTRFPDAVVAAYGTDVGKPYGFKTYVPPPEGIKNLKAEKHLDPTKLKLSWKSKDSSVGGYAVAVAEGKTAPSVCTDDDVVPSKALNKSTQKDPEYVQSVDTTRKNLTGGQTYSIRTCALNGMDPADLSAGKTVTIKTTERAQATLADVPADPSNDSSLGVTVDGEGVSHYKYAYLSDATGCDGASYSDWIAVSETITDPISTDGNKALCVLGKKNDQNVQKDPTVHTWVQDTVAPGAFSITGPSSSPLANDTPKATWETASEATHYDLTVSPNADCSSPSQTHDGLEATDKTLSSAADGTYYLCVTASDAAGNTKSATNDGYSFEIDTTAPTFTSVDRINAASDGYINASEHTGSTALVGNLSASGYTSSAYVLVARGTTCDGSLTYGSVPNSDDAGFTADGSYKVCVKLTDDAGNTTYGASNGIVLDTSLPTFTSVDRGSVASDGYVNISENSSSQDLATNLTASGHDTASYKLTGSGTTCDGSLTYGASVPKTDSADFGADGDYKVCVELTDDAQNPAAYGATSTFTLDTSAPTFTSLDRGAAASDGYVNISEHAASTDLATNLAASGHDTASYKLTSSGTTCDGSLTYGASVPKTDSTDFGADGDYKVCVQLTDDAQNPAAYGATLAFTLDTSAPTLTSLDRGAAASDGYVNISEHAASTDLATNLTASGHDTASYKLTGSGTTCDGSLTYGASVPKTDSADFGADGDYKVCVELTDDAQNPADYGATSAFTLDTAAPTFTSISRVNDASDGLINASEHSGSSQDLVSLSASGYSTAGYALTAFATACDDSLSFGGVPTSDSADFGSDGDYRVCVELLDAAGNSVYDTSAKITLDSSAPTFNSLPLANDASDDYINSAETANTAAMAGPLDASGYDTAGYKLVATGTNCDGALTYGSSIPSSDSADFGSDGDYKICVKLTDDAGNPADYGSSPTITLDTSVPTFTSLDLANDATDGYINKQEHTGSTAALAANLSASGHDSVGYKLTTAATTCDGSLTYGGSIPASDSTEFGSDGSYKVCIELTDQAGNPADYGATNSFTLDTTLPVFTSIDLVNDASDGYINADEHANSSQALAGNLNASGHSTDQYKLAATSTTCDGALTYGAMPGSDSADFGTDGPYYVCVKLADAAGNESYDSSNTITLDTTAPSGTAVSLANDASDNYINASEHTNSTAMASAATASGHDQIGYKLTSFGTTCDGSLPYGGSIPKNDSTDFGADGDYKICVEASDNAGNPSDYSASAKITLDTTAPSFTSVSLAGDATDGYINNNEHGNSNPLASISASGYDTDAYNLAPSGTTCDGSLSYGSMPQSNSTDFGADGEYIVCVELTDAAGNPAAYDASPTITLATALPSSTVTTSGGVDNDTTSGSMTDLEGTASAGTAPLSTVKVSVDAGTFCLNDSKTAFDAGCPNWLDATGTSSWSVAVDDCRFDQNTRYGIESQAIDDAGNYQAPTATNSMTWTFTEGSTMWCTDIQTTATGDERPQASAVASAGSLFVGGISAATDQDWWLRKFSAEGSEDTASWNKTADGGTGDDALKDIAVDSSGNVYAVGSQKGATLDWWIKKYASDGTEDTLSWNKTVDGNAGKDAALAVAIDSGDNVYVAGYGTNVANMTSGEDWWIRKYNSSGVQQCESQIDVGGDKFDDRIHDLVIDDGADALYAVGYDGSVSGNAWFISKHSLTDCSQATSKTVTNNNGDDKAFAVDLDGAGNIFVAGSTNKNGNADWWIKKFDSSLVDGCSILNDDSGTNQAFDLVVDSDSNLVYAAGYRGTTTRDWWLRQFDTSCNEDTLDWPLLQDGNSADDEIHSLSLSKGTDDVDNIYVIGHGTGLSGSSYEEWWIRKLKGVN